jgi:DNA polymerase-3 subunit gamma/tau
MRDALSLTDQAIAFGNGQLQEAGVRQMLGSVDRSHVLQLIRALTEGDGATVVNQINALRLQGVSAAATLEDMAMLLQRMAVMQMVPSMAQDGDDPDTQGLAELAAAMPAEETQLLYSLCLHGRTELGLAPDEYAAMTMVLLRLLAFKPPAGMAEKKSPLSSEGSNPSSTPSAAPRTRGEPIAATLAAPTAAPLAPNLTAPESVPTSAPVSTPAATPASLSPAAAALPVRTARSETDASPAPLAVAKAKPLLAPVALDTPPPKAQAEPVAFPNAVQPAAPASDEPPPWEDWPDTTDYKAQDALASVSAVDAPSAATLRALPVREADAPSARLDMPRAAAPVAVQATPEGDVWLDVVQGLLDQEAITALVRELALQSQLLGRDGGRWQLRVERETLNHSTSRERLQAALIAAGHGDVRLHIEVGPVSDSPARRLAVKAAEKMLAAQDLIQNDPLVQAMVRDFGAKIVPGSIQLI